MSDKEYILCAAIKRKTPRDCKPYHEGANDICDIEIGYRHHDIIQRFGKDVLDLSKQGFYTSKGRFVGRTGAYFIALEAGQIRYTPNSNSLLFSEDLY